MSDEKTEEPSEKKLRKVREEGQVAKSSDLVEVACLGVVFVALQAGAAHIADMLRAVLDDALVFAAGAHSMQDLLHALFDIGRYAIELLIGIAALALFAAVLALLPQTGMQISMAAASPKLASVSPASGLKRMVSLTSLLDLVKMTLKAAILIVVMWQTIKSSLPVVASALDHSIPQLVTVLWSVLMHVVAVAFGVFVVIGAVDYRLQKWLFIRRNRMSKDELKREHKESDGNPEMKGERKRLARELSQEGPKRGVGRATVVVVNPVHYAVALRYDPAEFPLPVVLARGVDGEALLLRRYATELGVPIVANPPVARMLHKVPENQPIPEELFEVVAAILRWVDGLAPRAGGTVARGGGSRGVGSGAGAPASVASASVASASVASASVASASVASGSVAPASTASTSASSVSAAAAPVASASATSTSGAVDSIAAASVAATAAAPASVAPAPAPDSLPAAEPSTPTTPPVPATATTSVRTE